MANEILQGTTPSLRITSQDLDMQDVAVLRLTFAYNNTVLNKGLSDVEVEEHGFTYTFSQEETLELDPTTVMKFQFRVKLNDGKVLGIRIKKIAVSELLDGEVI